MQPAVCLLVCLCVSVRVSLSVGVTLCLHVCVGVTLSSPWFRVDLTMADAWEVGLAQRGRAANIGAPLVRYLYHLLHFVYGDVDPASHFL